MVEINRSATNGHTPASETKADWKAAESELLMAAQEMLEVARLRWHRLRLGAKEGVHSVLLGLWLAVVGLVASVIATVLLILGLAGGVSALANDQPWVGRLVIGAVVIFGTVLGLRSLRTTMRQSFLRNLEERDRRETQPDNPTAAEATS